MKHRLGTHLLPMIATAAVAGAAVGVRAQTLEGPALADVLAGGGYVLVMRHASSPAERPSEERAAPENVARERQLDETGRAHMVAMAYAFRELGLPVGDLLTSPAYRAVESGRYFGFGEQQSVAELGEEGDAAWLADKVKEPPRAGNTVIITHRANIVEAFGQDFTDIATGESLIFEPGGDDAELVARMTIRDWAVLAVDLD